MKLILGQGNPGQNYAKTRHNVGFMVLDKLAKKNDAKWIEKVKWKAQIAEFNYMNDKVILVKPTCYYNLTGQVLRQMSDFYNLDPKKDVLVIHDDLALKLGQIRYRKQGSSAGNNGVKSIIEHIGEEFDRIRIGIKQEGQIIEDSASYVLGKFNSEENRKLIEIIDSSMELIVPFLDDVAEAISVSL